MTPQHLAEQTAGRFAAGVGAAALTHERRADHTVVAVSGELDFSSTPRLRERLFVALRDPGAYIVIDLADVTFCDASGLALLVGARRRAEATGAAVILNRPRPQVARLLRVTGLSHGFTVRSTGADARDAGPDVQSPAA
ncbi:STAS domain-containing protein [Actinomadura sp. 9N215]|uniref:STAS domain-containing protein n=1 Tax=Actinomadura sp. 9N215 TaxID=3375150 RepID=UPI00379AF81A